MESEKNYSRWMTDLPESVTNVLISCLAIPGSHDSGTCGLDPAYGTAVDQSACIQWVGNFCCVQSIIYRWSKTQHLSISEQLRAGVRYFDLRVALHPSRDELRFVHVQYGGLVHLALDDINTFLTHNPKEVVILDFNHFYNMNDIAHQRLLGEVRKVFDQKSVPPCDFTAITLRALWQTQNRVITIYQDQIVKQYPEIWGASTIASPWANTNDLSTLIRFLEANYSHRREGTICLFSFQGILTPSKCDIIPKLYSSLEAVMATKATREFVKWLKSGKVPSPQGINICVADFVEKNNFIQTVVELNKKITDNRSQLFILLNRARI